MTDALAFAPESSEAIPLHVVEDTAFDSWGETQPEAVVGRLRRLGFTGALGQTFLLDGAFGEIAVTGYGNAEARARGRFHIAAAAAALPQGVYRLASALEPAERDEAALGWLLAGYRFDRYAAATPIRARLIAPEGCDAARLEALAAGEALTRDLINTPANDLGPAELEAAARSLAERHGAAIEVIRGAALSDGFPLIQAVGAAAIPARAPRLIDLRHGTDGPALTLVGKGVCFDTGGLNLKPGASMALMKKDMGGAAHVLGLAETILRQGWPLRLRVLIPAVENAVAGASFRPGDIFQARSGKTVEINNTDAEGRLVLADALTYASETREPGRVISMATLTGAARVAVGPDIAPFFTGDEALAAALMTAGDTAADPVWRLPFHAPYEAMIEPGIADLDNAPKGGFAGAITAALFLRRFAGDPALYTHFDVYGWQPSAAPARPKGGAAQGTRALFAALPAVLGL